MNKVIQYLSMFCKALFGLIIISSQTQAAPKFQALNNVAPSYYRPVTLTNSAGSATTTNLQVKVTINSNSNSSKYSSNLANVNWQDGSGNVYNSWLESGATNTSTTTTYWINLGTKTIAGSGGTLVIYQVLYATGSIAMNGTATGAFPSYSGTYAQYDNGATVFTAPYTNFAGTSVPAGWQKLLWNGGTATINNGVTFTTGGSNTIGAFMETTTTYNVPIIESNMNFGTQEDSDSTPMIVFAKSALSTSSGDLGNVNSYRFDYWSTYQRIIVNVSSSGTNIGQYSTSWSGMSGIWTGTWNATGSLTFSVDYSPILTSGDTSIAKAATYLAVGSPEGGTTSINWFRARNYPPSGTLPTAAAGSMTAIVNNGFIFNPF